MTIVLTQDHWLDAQGNPAGGISQGPGFTISWQNGPLGRGPERREPNGAFVENIIAAAIGRLSFYQGSQFACEENAQAYDLLCSALWWLNQRTKRREHQEVEGTHAGS